MSEGFRKYDHVERLDHEDVDGLLVGRVHVFPKLDGTNGSVWRAFDGAVREQRTKAASRNRELTVDDDNQGFARFVLEDGQKFQSIPPDDWVVYGEWLVPHTLKTYRQDAWRRFWVFDVYSRALNRYLAFEEYEPTLTASGMDVIRPLAIYTNPSRENLHGLVETNTFLIADGAGVGEGLVLKNYDWRNKFGRQPWAKIVRNEFKEQASVAMGIAELDGPFQVELAIAQEFCNTALVSKTRAKVVADVASQNGIDLATDPNAQATVEATHRGKVIPQLLSRVFHDLVTEDLWAALKRHKNPTVDFKLLQRHTTNAVKTLAQDLFQ